MSEPQSRNEAILQSIIDETQYTAPPQSRIEDLLIELKETISTASGIGVEVQGKKLVFTHTDEEV